MANSDYKVVPFEFGDEWTIEERFIVVDPETGEVLDDCNGYGYSTEVSAHRGYSFKLKSKEEQETIKALQKKVKSWWQRHSGVRKQFCSWCDSDTPLDKRVEMLERIFQRIGFKKDGGKWAKLSESNLTPELVARYIPKKYLNRK